MISDSTLWLVLRSHRAVLLWGDLIRVAIAAVVILLSLAWLAYYSMLGTVLIKLNMNDFGKFYYSAQLFLEGQDMYAPSPATNIPVGEKESLEFLNLNPPHFHIVILPLALLSAPWALFVWTLANTLILVACLRLIAGELTLHWTVAGVVWLAFGIIACSATGTIVVTGQLTFLLLLPVTAAWIAARRGDWSGAALYLGICASIKPFFGIFLLYFILTRRAVPALLMLAVGGACGVLGVAVFGWQAYQAWLGALSSVGWAWAPMNGSIAGFFARSFGENPFFTPLLLSPLLAVHGATLISLVVGCLSLAALASGRSGQSADRVFAGLLLTAQLVSPLGWMYYLWLPLGPIAGLATTWRSRHRETTGLEVKRQNQVLRRLCTVLPSLSLPGLLWPLTLTTAGQPSPWATATVGSVYFWTTLLLWAGVLVQYDLVGTGHHREASRLVRGGDRVVEDHGFVT